MGAELQPEKRVGTSLRKRKKLKPEELKALHREKDRRDQELLEFIQAIDRYKRKSFRLFLTWSEVMEIFRSLGYRKLKT